MNEGTIFCNNDTHAYQDCVYWENGPITERP